MLGCLRLYKDVKLERADRSSVVFVHSDLSNLISLDLLLSKGGSGVDVEGRVALVNAPGC